MPREEDKPRPRLIKSKTVRPERANRGLYGPGKKREKVLKGDGKSLCANSEENKEGKMASKEKKKLERRMFADEKTAITALMKEKGYYSLRYNLSAKQKTPERIHWSDVWIILPGGIAGRCIISVAGYLDETFELFQDRAIAILVPAESRYYLEGLSPNMFYSILSQE